MAYRYDVSNALSIEKILFRTSCILVAFCGHVHIFV
jgi:hypothetical protein